MACCACMRLAVLCMRGCAAAQAAERDPIGLGFA